MLEAMHPVAEEAHRECDHQDLEPEGTKLVGRSKHELVSEKVLRNEREQGKHDHRSGRIDEVESDESCNDIAGQNGFLRNRVAIGVNPLHDDDRRDQEQLISFQPASDGAICCDAQNVEEHIRDWEYQHTADVEDCFGGGRA